MVRFGLWLLGHYCGFLIFKYISCERHIHSPNLSLFFSLTLTHTQTPQRKTCLSFLRHCHTVTTYSVITEIGQIEMKKYTDKRNTWARGELIELILEKQHVLDTTVHSDHKEKKCSFWRCSDSVFYPSQLGLCQTCRFFLLLKHQLWGQKVHLLPNNPDNIPPTSRCPDEEFFTSFISDHNVMPDRCISI